MRIKNLWWWARQCDAKLISSSNAFSVLQKKQVNGE
jgi:hypothetical protein